MSFESLGLAPALLRALADQGYANPTPIQAGAIPVVLEGHDLLAAAQTGTGKTAAFALPLLHKLASAGPTMTRRPRALVLTPTRELAAQVNDNLRDYGRHLRVSSTTIFGGVSMPKEVFEHLKKVWVSQQQLRIKEWDGDDSGAGEAPPRRSGPRPGGFKGPAKGGPGKRPQGGKPFKKKY